MCKDKRHICPFVQLIKHHAKKTYGGAVSVTSLADLINGKEHLIYI
jgi:hypothetical protein